MPGSVPRPGVLDIASDPEVFSAFSRLLVMQHLGTASDVESYRGPPAFPYAFYQLSPHGIGIAGWIPYPPYCDLFTLLRESPGTMIS